MDEIHYLWVWLQSEVSDVKVPKKKGCWCILIETVFKEDFKTFLQYIQFFNQYDMSDNVVFVSLCSIPFEFQATYSNSRELSPHCYGPHRGGPSPLHPHRKHRWVCSECWCLLHLPSSSHHLWCGLFHACAGILW